MERIEKETDVLVVGGGLAGCWAAIRAKEFAPRVTLVDKAIISRSGCSSWAYYLLAPPPVEERQVWAKEMVGRGDFMNNQEWVEVLLREHPQRIQQMQSWGIPFETDEKGQLLVKKGRGHRNTGFVSSDASTRMGRLKKIAAERGVEIVERVMLTDLLTSDGRYPTNGSVVGIVGWQVRTGKMLVIRSKSVVLATGPITPSSNLSGDGQGMAFRAGAELMGMEFCTSPTAYITDSKRRQLSSINVLFASLGFRILNNRGERFMEKYDPVLKERTDWPLLCLAFAKENIEGRGPTLLDMSQVKQEDIDYFARLHPGRMAPFLEAGIDLSKDKLVCTADNKIGSSNGEGGIRIDIEGKTSIPGLYAAGSVCKNPVHGTYTVGGVNLAFCCTSGYRAGERAGKDSLSRETPKLADFPLDSLQKALFAPLERKRGSLPDQLLDRIDEIITPARVSLIKREDHLKEALAALEQLERDVLPGVRARDLHELQKAEGARNTLLIGKLTFLASLERKECRRGHYREDYPFRDDINWLKWIVLRSGGADKVDMKIENIPFDKYPFKPEKREKIPHIIQFT